MTSLSLCGCWMFVKLKERLLSLFFLQTIRSRWDFFSLLPATQMKRRQPSLQPITPKPSGWIYRTPGTVGIFYFLFKIQKACLGWSCSMKQFVQSKLWTSSHFSEIHYKSKVIWGEIKNGLSNGLSCNAVQTLTGWKFQPFIHCDVKEPLLKERRKRS